MDMIMGTVYLFKLSFFTLLLFYCDVVLLK